MLDLHLIWFVLMAILLAGYAVLDGFDLGVGILHPLARGDRERRLFINSIGPLWDGNEVWLVTFGGAMFAMFPQAYATIFSAFYLAFMLLLFALIFRAVSLEFRGKMQSPVWRRAWDFGFFASSILATFLFGVAVGNGIKGIPLNASGIFTGGFLDLVGPYQLLVGLLAVALFAMHGALFLYLKTAGAVQERLGPWMWHTWGLFLTLYILTTIYTLMSVPAAADNFRHYPWAVAVVVVNVLAITNIPRTLFRRSYGQAFFSSVLTILCLVFLFAMAVFPNIVSASNDPALSWTMRTAASSDTTLTIGLIIVAIGFPFVLAYTAVIYWTFWGKVELGEDSY
jgi:cytochrome d ubiquinol oxidase subunit II